MIGEGGVKSKAKESESSLRRVGGGGREGGELFKSHCCLGWLAALRCAESRICV